MVTTISTSPRSSGDPDTLTLPASVALHHLRCTTRSDGDLHPDHVAPAELAARRAAVCSLPWTQLDEVHGTEVLVVDRPGRHDGAVGDAAVTTLFDAALCVWVGDCAPVALFSDGGGIGVVHAGWRGLYDGVLAAAVTRLRAIAPGTVRAVLGPSIHPCCYEFSANDLAPFVDRWGDSVASRTATGRPALDVPAAVRIALGELDVDLDHLGACTACRADRYWSHRARGELGRQGVVVWQTANVGSEP